MIYCFLYLIGILDNIVHRVSKTLTWNSNNVNQWEKQHCMCETT